MFRKQKDVCFFCNTSVPTISKSFRKGFRCPHCECWNSEEPEPAMRIESLNTQSFSKRASPNKDRIPSNFSSKSVFCHTCETNQHLVLHLLSNYLPPPTDPEYEQRLQMLPQYTESLHQRYPQVCDSCLPLVEDEIRRKDDMARSQALGGWLKQTKGKAKQRRVSATLQEREVLSKALIIWRIRGCCWGITLLLFVVGYAAVLFDQRPFHRLSLIQPVLPVFMLLSVLWTAWDPTYASMRTAQIQGRDVRVQGKRQYIVLQMILWVSRLATATLLALQWFHMDYLHMSQRPPHLMSKLYFLFSLLLETSVSIASFSILRLQRPPTIRLINTKTDDLGRSRSSTPNPANDSRAGTPFPPGKVTEPDLFASLSLSSQPIVSKNAPIFGVPSLSVPSSRTENTDKDEMDWSPTSTNPNANGTFSANKRFKPPADDDGSWLRPQRFFAPEKPTGLESLFENTKLIDDVPMQDGTGPSKSLSDGQSSTSEWQPILKHIEIWWWIYVAVLVLSMGVLLKFWIGRAPIALHSLSYDDAGDPIQQSGVYRHTSRSNVIPQ